MKNLCSIDLQTGKSVFNGQLFRQFEQYDKDNSGYLSKDELSLLIKDIFKDYIRIVEKSNDKATIDNLKEMLQNI